MKKDGFSKTIAAFLALIMAFGLIPSRGFAQTSPLLPTGAEIKGFDKSVFDYHFSRADREVNPDRWLAEAKHGISLALCAWEFFASALYDNPLIFEEAKAQIEEWSNEELQARFSLWLNSRFFGAAMENAMADLSVLFSETQKNYTWRLDDEGNIVFEDKTHDPLVIRPGENGRDFSDDLIKWYGDAQAHIKTENDSLDAVMARMYTELLFYIPIELRETLNIVITETGAAMNGAIKREFENIAARESRIFTSRRTRDVWSLRKKSNDEAARILIEQLISEAEMTCGRGIDELKARIEEASAGTGDLALMGEEWLKLYQEQFDRGLKAWEEAEERFFIRRIEWEQESINLFSEGEEAWLSAFRSFEEERQRWELKTKELFASGEFLFKNISENFEKAIADAKAEFEYNMTMRIGAGTAKVKAMVDMYLVCGSGAIAARDNVLFWQKQIKNSDKADPSDPFFTDWLLQEKKSFWLQAEASYKTRLGYLKSLSELETLKNEMEQEEDSDKKKTAEDNYLKYIKSLSSKHRILFLIQDAIAGKINEAGEYALAKEIKSLGILNTADFEALTEIKKSYDLYISYMDKARDTRSRIMADYGELIGTGVLKDILAQDASSEDFCLDEYQIALIKAKAVVLYWERKTSIAEAVMDYARELDAGRMTEAESIRAWENAKSSYYEALASYEDELKKLNALGSVIQGKQAALDDLAMMLKQAEEKLNRLNSDYSSLITANAINRDSFLLAEFNTKYQFLVDEYKELLKTGNDAVYKTSLDYGREWGITLQRENAGIILEMLLNGDGAQIPSLVDLKNSVNNGHELEINLRLRLAAIDLFADTIDGTLRPADSAYGGADWYFRARGLVPAEDKKAALYGEKLQAQLVSDYKNSSRLLLEKRIALELEALDCFLNEITGFDSNEMILSQFCLVDKDTATRGFEILAGLQKRLRLGQEFYSGNDEENEILNWFLSGGSFFAGSDMYLADYFDDYNFCLGLLETYNNYAAFSSFVQAEYWQDTVVLLRTLFSGYELDMPQTSLPGVQSISEAIFRLPGDFTHNAAKFLLEFEQCFLMLPEWLEYELNNWKTSFIDYIAANALYKEMKSLNNSQYLTAEQDGLQERYRELDEYIGSLVYTDEITMEIINDILSKIYADETMLSYKQQITFAWEKYNGETMRAGNEKHWRQFLADGYLNDSDPSLAEAYSWIEGAMFDAFDDANFITNRINDAFALYSQKSANTINTSAVFLSDLYISEFSRAQRRINYAKSFWSELAGLGRAYEYSKMPTAELQAELERQYAALKAQEEQYNTFRNSYLFEAGEFVKTGVLYDNQYSNLKKAYDTAEKKRLEYETQDAIRRWASTAYLDTDIIDLFNCRDKLTKSQTILAVLSDLYNGESRRPYDNPEYHALYLEYEQSFGRKLNAMKTLDAIQNAFTEEQNKNENIFSLYHSAINALGRVDQNYSNYISSKDKSAWSIKDIITVKDGRLAFSKDQSMVLGGIDDSKAQALQDYFSLSSTPDGEWHEITRFEAELRGLSQRMSGYLTNANKMDQWSLARDYLLYSLINANGNLNFLKNYYSGGGEMERDGSLASLPFKSSPSTRIETLYSAARLNSAFSTALKYPEAAMQNAWNNLSNEERADLEFYVILTLSGNCNNYIAGFSLVHTLDVYEKGYDLVWEYFIKAWNECNAWWKLWSFGIYNEMKEINASTSMRFAPVLKETRNKVYKWKSGLDINLKQIEYQILEYKKSCTRLNILEGKSKDDQSIGWDEIYLSILESGKMKDEDIDLLKTSWDAMRSESGINYLSVSSALSDLVRWTGIMVNKCRQDLENRWIVDEQKRLKDENEFYAAMESYIAGTIDTATLKTIAEKTFGKNAPAWKNHLENLEKVLMQDISFYLDCDSDYFAEFSSLGHELTAVVARTLGGRYAAEFTARETEWQQQREDIAEKYREWQENAALLVENGRTDWNAGIQKLEESYKQWNISFRVEYDYVKDQWAEAYLAGLEDKEKWLEMAAAAADQASSEALLSLVGAEAQRMTRLMDIREPVGIRGAVPDVENILAGLLKSPGIVNVYNAFDSFNTIADLASPVIRRGMGGITVWDSAITRAAASELARKTNAEIADREARKLAFSSRMAAEEAIKALASHVDSANNDFRESMDDTFIFKGLWNKSGNNYTKRIITGSTFFEPVVSVMRGVQGYVDYRMEPVELKTNLDENYLAGLNSLAVRGLLENVYLELDTITKEIFGIGESAVKISRANLEDRYLSPGKFGAHIGYVPLAKPSKEMGDSKESMFYDNGSGELGRLISEFIYWSVIDGKGTAELYLAAWDKRLWDDRGSSFAAPTLRGVAQVVGQIVGAAVSVATAPYTGGASIAGMVGLMALNAGIASTSELIFNTLDFAYGYKSFDEAGFSFAKTSLISAVNSVGSGIFNGVGNAGFFAGETLTKAVTNATTGTVNKIIAQTAMAGLQTAATGVTTGLINGITYSRQNGLGFSAEIAANGVHGAMTGALTSMASAFTTGTLQAINSGMNLEKLLGFSNINKMDLGKFNNLAGSLVGQGVNFALGNDFSLNLLNTSLLTGGKIDTGLLELHIGHDGSTMMNIGTGGANVSIDNVFSAFKGALVWNVNSNIDKYVKKGGLDLKNALRAQYGFGDTVQTEQLWNILKEIDTLRAGDGEGFGAETKIINGKRVVTLNNYREGMSVEEQMLFAVLLGHEAYRDGIVTADNNLETRMATLAHTEMALRMMIDGQSIKFDEGLADNLAAYFSGDREHFNSYVDENYDSSADYWRLVKDKNGNWDWEEDGDFNFNFDLNDKEIATAFFKSIRLNNIFHIDNPSGIVSYAVSPSGTATIKFTNMTSYFAGLFGDILGIKDTIPVLTTPENKIKKFALNDFVNKTQSLVTESNNTIAQLNNYISIVNQLRENGVGYGFAGEKFDNWIVNSNSTSMDCIGMMSYILKFPLHYDVANFDKYKNFEKVQTAMPGDLIAFVANNGKRSDNHIVGYLGSYGPASGKKDQIFDSSFYTGPRFSTLTELTNYYTKEEFTYTMNVYRPKR